MRAPSALRRLARRIGPLYWLAGWVRLVRFKARLAAQDRVYAQRPSPKVPPPLLRFRVHGALDEASYAEAGQAIASRIIAAFRARGLDPANAKLLDFGCGPGRVAAQVKALVPTCWLHGSDIDADAISWARDHLPEVAVFELNGPSPPTRYEDGFFDGVYTVSLFTHIDEAPQLAWLAELARILRPGGLVIATVHGACARASCTRVELRRLASHGFAYRVDRTGRQKLDGLPDSYQTTFHDHDYVIRTWNRSLQVVEYAEGGLGGHQDLVVLQRP